MKKSRQEKPIMTENMINMINSFNNLFDAVQSTANRAAHIVGYNTAFEIMPNISVTYELRNYGPDHIAAGQHPAENEYGPHIDPIKDDTLSPDERFWAMERAYRIITVRENNNIAFRMEGQRGLHTTEYPVPQPAVRPDLPGNRPGCDSFPREQWKGE